MSRLQSVLTDTVMNHLTGQEQRQLTIQVNPPP